MMETPARNLNSFHLAGIVPVAGSGADYGMDWDPCLMPVAPGFSAIEHAVQECAHLGCETIWVVCNDDIAPLLKHRLGDYVRNVESLERGSFIKFSSSAYTSIPIYYVPIHPTHRGKIDCYAWSVLHGANTAYWLTRRLSRWMIPDRYYVSFPMGIYDPSIVKKDRKRVRGESAYYLSFQGQTVCDGLPLGFTFDTEEWKRARDLIKKNSRTYAAPRPGQMPSQLLPPSERRVSRTYSLADVFGEGPVHDATIGEINWFYDLTKWSGYCNLLASPQCKELLAPSELAFPRAALNNIGDTE